MINNRKTTAMQLVGRLPDLLTIKRRIHKQVKPHDGGTKLTKTVKQQKKKIVTPIRVENIRMPEDKLRGIAY
jgi:hypothetical protein